MKVLFLTVAPFQGIGERGIYTDLLRQFRDRGHEVMVVCPRERREGGNTTLVNDEGIQVLRVRTWNLTKAGIVEKTLATLLLERQFRLAIQRVAGRAGFDLVLYSTPPITFDRVVAHLKRRGVGTSYLLLKDIFPQNAVDLDMIQCHGLAWRYFRLRERRLYEVSDWIGCMSEANVRYLLEHNPSVDGGRIEVCPNAIDPRPTSAFRQMRTAARERLGLRENEIVLLYGGNFGKPQGVDFIIECARRCSEIPGAVMLLVGSGTEYMRLEEFVAAHHSSSVRLMPSVSRPEYDSLLAAADVGLVFLDYRFTIPNFPSRLTGYLEAGLPVLAATDRVSDVGTVLTSAKAGLWVPSNDVEAFVDAARSLVQDDGRRRQMGAAGRAYLEAHYTVENAYKAIVARVECS